MSSSKVQPNSDYDDNGGKSSLPMRSIPGSYGTPFLSPIRDRLDYFYNQGKEEFFRSRVEKYDSTVFRTNMPPGPFIASNPQVIALLDAQSFPVLFDNTKVEKKNIFTGTYMASTSFTGGYRVCSYLDPSEPTHKKVKQLLINLLTSRKSFFIPSFLSAYSSLFQTMESQLLISPDNKNKNKSSSSDFNKLNDSFAFDFVGDAYFGSLPSLFPSLGPTGPSKATKWLFPQLSPILTLGLPKVVEEIFLRTFPIPSWIFRSDYKALRSYITSAVPGTVLEDARKLGLSEDEAIDNLLFATVFNTYAGMKTLFPIILQWISVAGPKLHARLAQEIRPVVVEAGGKITLPALEKLDLTLSVVYEILRISPPVEFQYGKAKKDLVVHSHDAGYQIKKGEMLFGYQPFATRDSKVFENGDEFVGDRFVGDKGKKLLKYLLWSNGPETENPTVDNKQCLGKDIVVLVGRLFLVQFFLRYDTFTADVGESLIGPQITVTSLTKATTIHGTTYVV